MASLETGLGSIYAQDMFQDSAYGPKEEKKKSENTYASFGETPSLRMCHSRRLGVLWVTPKLRDVHHRP